MGMVDLDIADSVATLTFDFPERRNALASDLVAGALDAIGASRKAGARAVVVTGVAPAFCAGADVRDLLRSGWMEADPTGPTPYDLFAALEADPRPVVAAVEGAALGGGFELCLCCDLVIAAEPAIFALPEIGLGVVPNTALGRLPAIVGRRVAADLVLTRRKLTAADAATLGLVNKVTAPGEALATAVEAAGRIVRGAPPSAIAAVKRALARPQPLSWADIRAVVAEVDRAEWEEGLGAFLDKRRPDYDSFWEETARPAEPGKDGTP